MVRLADYNKDAGADFGVGGSRQMVGGEGSNRGLPSLSLIPQS